MKGFLILFILLDQATVSANAKTHLVVDERVENCAKEDEDYDLFDLTNFELIAHNDTHTFLNGSITFKKKVQSPWVTHGHAEHLENGKWLLQGYVNSYKDFCVEIHNPIRPWYKITTNLTGCPIPAGYTWRLDMISVEIPESTLTLLPYNYIGQWRLVMQEEHNINGKVLRDCKIGYAEIFMNSYIR